MANSQPQVGQQTSASALVTSQGNVLSSGGVRTMHRTAQFGHGMSFNSVSIVVLPRHVFHAPF
jgi:hypothetical protein